MAIDRKALWITRSAIFIALVIVAQAATAPLGITLITGSLVNLILIVSVMTCGLYSGLAVSLVSPFFAKLFGIGPLWTLIPFIAVGNVALVVVWHLIGHREIINKYVAQILALAVAAVAKFLVLYLGVVQIAIPLLLDLPEKQAQVISSTFSVQQLFTASIGGALAVIVLPLVWKAIRR